MKRRKRRFSISFVLIPVCLIITGAYLIMIGPELWKDNPTHIDHATQQFNLKMKAATTTAAQAEDTGNFELAFSAYREAIGIRPKNSQAHNDFGAVLMKAAEAQLEPMEAPIDLAGYAIEFDHNPLITFDYIKTALRSIPSEKSGQFQFEVRKDVRNLIHDHMEIWNKNGKRAIMSSHPLRTEDDGTTIYSVYLIYGKAASYIESAEKRFRRAIELTPEYAVAYRNLGAVFMLLQQPADSKRVLQQALRFNPKDRDLQRYLNRL